MWRKPDRASGVLRVVVGLVTWGLIAGGAGLAQAAPVSPQATPPEMAKVAVDFADALGAGKLTEAWGLLSAQSQAGTSAADWQAAYEQRPSYLRKPPASSVLRAVATAESAPKVDDVLLRGQEAFVAVTGTVNVTQQVVLVKEAAGWRVDLAASDRLNSREAASTFLAAIREEAVAAQRPRQGQEASLPLLRAMMSGEADDYQVTGANVEGSRAQITLTAAIPVNLVLRANRSGPGWVVDLSRPLLPLDISTPDPLKAAADMADRMQCEQQLTQLARAIRMYASSSNDMLPDPARWTEQIRPFLAQGSKLHCPTDLAPGISYAMNRNLAGRKLGEIANPGLTVLLYESTLHGNNPADTGETWPRERRHGEGNLVAYVDGSVRVVSIKPPFQVKEGPPGEGKVAVPGRRGQPGQPVARPAGPGSVRTPARPPRPGGPAAPRPPAPR